MLLHCSPIVFDGPELLLPSWIRSPCNLFQGASVFVAAYERHHSRVPALMISPFEPQFWSDVWRIDMDIKDSVGVSWRILRQLENLGVKVLCSESSAISNGKVHRLCFICSMLNYVSQNDGKSAYRSNLKQCSLPDLYTSLLLELVEDISMQSKRRPRLQVRRIGTYHEAKRSIEKEDSDTNGAFQTCISNGLIKLPDRVYNAVRDYGPKGRELRAIVTCDSTDRVIHIIFSAEGKSGTNCRIIFNREIVDFHKILRAVSEKGLNILRSQMRPGLIRSRMAGTDEQFSTLTLFVRDENGDREVAGDRIIEVIEHALESAKVGEKGRDWLVEPSHLYRNGVMVENGR